MFCLISSFALFCVAFFAMARGSRYSIALFCVAFFAMASSAAPFEMMNRRLESGVGQVCRVSPKGCRVVSGANNGLQSERMSSGKWCQQLNFLFQHLVPPCMVFG
jgi:hypothetical protein